MDHHCYISLQSFIAQNATFAAEPGRPMLVRGKEVEMSFDLDRILYTQSTLQQAVELLTGLLPPGTTHLGHVAGGEHTPMLFGALMQHLHTAQAGEFKSFSVARQAPENPQRKLAMGYQPAVSPLPMQQQVVRPAFGNGAKRPPQRSIKGLAPNQESRVVLVDMLVTTAEDLINAAATLREQAGVPASHLMVVTLIERRKDVREALHEKNIGYGTVFSQSDFLNRRP